MLRHRAIARWLAGVDPHHYLADVVPRLTGFVLPQGFVGIVAPWPGPPVDTRGSRSRCTSLRYHERCSCLADVQSAQDLLGAPAKEEVP